MSLALIPKVSSNDEVAQSHLVHAPVEEPRQFETPIQL